MGNYTRKTDGLAREVAPQLPILARITDLFIDIDDCGCGPTKSQLARLAKLTDEAMAQAAAGKIQLVSPVPPPAKTKDPWYGRNQQLSPLPGVTPRSYRMGGSRVC